MSHPPAPPRGWGIYSLSHTWWQCPSSFILLGPCFQGLSLLQAGIPGRTRGSDGVQGESCGGGDASSPESFMYKPFIGWFHSLVNRSWVPGVCTHFVRHRGWGQKEWKKREGKWERRYGLWQEGAHGLEWETDVKSTTTVKRDIYILDWISMDRMLWLWSWEVKGKGALQAGGGA